MSLSHISKFLKQNMVSRKKGYLHGGISGKNIFYPKNIIIWHSSLDSTLKIATANQRMILKIILKGELLLTVDGLVTQLKAGEGILFFPHQVHSGKLLCEADGYEYLAVTFLLEDNNYKALTPLKNRKLLISEEDERKLCELMRTYNLADNEQSEDAVWSLISFLRSQLQCVKNTKMEFQNGIADERFIWICDYYRNHFTENISLKVVAGEFGISEETVRRLFHAHYEGMTPGRFLQHLRIVFAMDLLANTSSTIETIAEKCGFSDSFTFSKAFKRTSGVSPLHYRKKLYNLP